MAWAESVSCCGPYAPIGGRDKVLPADISRAGGVFLVSPLPGLPGISLKLVPKQPDYRQGSQDPAQH